jgi:hypothetical protein
MNAPRGPYEKRVKTVRDNLEQSGNSSRFMLKPPVT